MDLVKDPAAVIIELHLKCVLSVKNSLELAIKVGEHLLAQKEAMDHGTFTPWIEETLPFSVRTAQNYLKIASRKKELLLAKVENLTEAYLMITPPKNNDDETMTEKLTETHPKTVLSKKNDNTDTVENPTYEGKFQDSQYTYWNHLGPLIENMNRVYERLAALRDSTTPKGIGYLIGNIKDMANVLDSWSNDNMEDCPDCSDGSCGICINGKIGIYQENDN